MNKTKWFKPNFDITEGLITENKEINKNTNYQDEIPKQTMKKKVQHIPKSKVVLDIDLLNVISPKSISDVAVHNKKIAEVENWIINNVITCNKVSVLLLSGPSGSGKTTTVKLLCKFLNVEIVEWINTPDLEVEEFRVPGQTARFMEFISQSSRFPSLFDTTSTFKKVILVEDFPNSLVRNPSDMEDILKNYIEIGKSPIVFICADTKDRSVNFAHLLFPQAIQEQYNIVSINFNPVSITLLKTMLKRATSIIQEKYNKSYQLPSQDAIETIINSSMGDIRCAINYFNFACLKGSKDLPSTIKESKITTGKRKRTEKLKSTLTNLCRDESLGLLHAIGRVLYPKRIENNPNWTFEHKPESIVDQYITQPTTFVAFLHENYQRYFSHFESACHAAELLSLSELFVSDWREKNDLMKYGMWIAVMGLMVLNKNAVHKWNPVRGPKRYNYRSHEKTSLETIQAIDKSYYDLLK